MMTKEQIITGIIDYLDHQLHGGMGHMQDKYYKGEFFHLFAEAYNLTDMRFTSTISF